jgi:hypothetical protein
MRCLLVFFVFFNGVTQDLGDLISQIPRNPEKITESGFYYPKKRGPFSFRVRAEIRLWGPARYSNSWNSHFFVSKGAKPKSHRSDIIAVVLSLPKMARCSPHELHEQPRDEHEAKCRRHRS